jgi:hypothetical protein
MSIRLMTAVWDADLSKVEWVIPAHMAPATRTRPERFMPSEKGTCSAADKSVLLALADHAADDGSSVYPSIATLMQKTEHSERTVRQSLRHLEGAGLMEQEKKPSQHRSAHYRLLPDKIRAARRAGLKDDPRPARGAGQKNEPDRHVAPPNHQESKSKATHQEAKSTPNHQETESKATKTKAHGSAASQSQPILDSPFAHQEHHAAVDVEAPLRDVGSDLPRTAEDGGVAPRGGPHQVQQQTDHIVERFRAHPSGLEFLRGDGTLREIFRGVEAWKLTWDQVRNLGFEIDDAIGIDFFENSGEDIGKPRCSPWEWLKEHLLERAVPEGN